MSDINDIDIIYILKDTNPREGDTLSIFRDINEAKWYAQLFLNAICNEHDTLEWVENDDGYFLSKSKYQSYAIIPVERSKFSRRVNYYLNVAGVHQ